MLRNGQRFPEISVDAVGGGLLSLPDDLAGSLGVVVIYRGAWCPVCVRQLEAFAAANETLSGAGVKIAALSADDETAASTLVEELQLPFPVGHSADARAIASATDAQLSDDARYLQPAGFILDPDGTIRLSVYSSGAQGRLTAEDIAGLLRYLSRQAAKTP
jgi:peroxiredoxin